MRAKLKAAFPETAGVPFAFVHGRLAALEASLDLAREAAAFLAPAPVRPLESVREEARALERLRDAKPRRALRSPEPRLDALIACLKRSGKQPATLARPLGRLAALTLGLEGALPPVYGNSFARVHFQLRWLDDALIQTVYTSEPRDALGFLASADAFAKELVRALEVRMTAGRHPAASETVRLGVDESPVPEPVFELLKQMNEKLEILRDRVEREEIDPGSDALSKALEGLRSLKLDLLEALPSAFHEPFWSLYLDLESVDRVLESMLERAAAASLLRGEPLNGATPYLVRGDAIYAKELKDRLELRLSRAAPLPPALLSKLRLLNDRLERVERTAIEDPAELLGLTADLPAIKAGLLDEFPSVFGAELVVVYLNLKWLDGAFDRPFGARGRVSSCERSGTLASSSSAWRRSSGQRSPSRLPRCRLHRHLRSSSWSRSPTTTIPPQSDICVTVTLDSPRPEAEVTIRLSGPISGSLSVKSDSEGKAHARFLVSAIGDYEVEVEVRTPDGRTAKKRVAFNNATPTAEPCR